MATRLDTGSTAPRLRDDPRGYGLVSRVLHWTMAVLIVWQLISVLLRVFAEDTPIEGFFWSTHYSNGFLIWCLVLVRGVWGLMNMARRPAHSGPPALRKAATLGHLALYLLMILVPTIALLRAYGSERGQAVFGMQLFAPREQEITSLVELGGNWHGELGFVLLTMATGHVAMALWHGYVRRDGTLQRMAWGRSDRPARL